MLAHGTQCPVLSEVEVGVIIQLHLKCRHKNVTNPIQKSKYRNMYKANSSKYKEKMELFRKEFVPELNTKTWATLPAFSPLLIRLCPLNGLERYGILMIDVATVFCFWIEQWQNGSSISRLRLAKTPEVPNTISESNSLHFLMV
jgi:hypothetical protein